MATQRATKFAFGFLNNAQEARDIKINEATRAEQVDLDKLALGSIQKSNYLPDTTDKDWLNTELNGRKFALTAGVIQWEDKPADPLRNLSDGVDLPTPPAPTIVNTDVVDIGTPTVIIPGQALFVPGDEVYEGPSIKTLVLTYDHTFTYSYDGGGAIVITPGDDKVQLRMRYKEDVPSVPGARYTQTDTTPDPDSVTTPRTFSHTDVFGNLDSIIDGITLPPLTGTPTTGPFTINQQDVTEITIQLPSLPDGDYSYRLMNINNGAANVSPLDDVAGVPSLATRFTVDNLDGVGDRLRSDGAEITIPANNVGANIQEVRLFRKDPNTEEYVLIYTNATASPVQFQDTTIISTLTDLTLLNEKDDETIPDIDTAIGNTNGLYDKIFQKDGRLWAVPKDRDGVLLYSRAGDFWGWQRNNSFAVEGVIRDIAFVRDAQAIGGTLTTVVFTDKSIYLISGNGSDPSPYILSEAIDGIDVEADSVINLPDKLIFLTKSATGAYNEGKYGQKIYEYDLINLKEVSARVQNSYVLTATTAVTLSKLLGGDKYLIQKAGAGPSLVYHKDAGGFSETTESLETADTWTWQSKVYTVEHRDNGKLQGIRKFRLLLTGIVTVTFTIFDNQGNSLTRQVTLGVAGQTIEYTRFLPQITGRAWQFKIETVENAILHDMYFLR